MQDKGSQSRYSEETRHLVIRVNPFLISGETSGLWGKTNSRSRILGEIIGELIGWIFINVLYILNYQYNFQTWKTPI